MGYDDSVKLSDHADDVSHDRHERGRVTFYGVGDIASKRNSDKGLAICNNVKRFGVCVAGIVESGLEGKCLGEHAAVVIFSQGSFALNMRPLKSVVVIDKGKSYRLSVRHKASIEGNGCVDIREGG